MEEGERQREEALLGPVACALPCVSMFSVIDLYTVHICLSGQQKLATDEEKPRLTVEKSRLE